MGLVGVLVPGIDTKLFAISERLTTHFETRGIAALQQEIQQLLTDDLDQDTEVYLLVGPDGKKLAGNLSGWPSSKMPLDRLTDQMVTRYGRASSSRVLPHELPKGATLLVGRDMEDVHEIAQLVLRALIVGGAIAVLLAIGGAVLFRQQLEPEPAIFPMTTPESASLELPSSVMAHSLQRYALRDWRTCSGEQSKQEP